MERRGVIRSKREGKSGRIYYQITSLGIEAEKTMTKKMKGLQKDMEEKLLGILCMHSQLFGRKALRDLLTRANNLEPS
jgi:DNA-binding PadR family transcriptional regulator